MTKIRKDELGLYAVIGGWICRPHPEGHIYWGFVNGKEFIYNGGTRFKEGDTVRGSHPPGHLAFLRTGKRGTDTYNMEKWQVIELVGDYKKRKKR